MNSNTSSTCVHDASLRSRSPRAAEIARPDAQISGKPASSTIFAERPLCASMANVSSGPSRNSENRLVFSDTPFPAVPRRVNANCGPYSPAIIGGVAHERRRVVNVKVFLRTFDIFLTEVSRLDVPACRDGNPLCRDARTDAKTDERRGPSALPSSRRDLESSTRSARNRGRRCTAASSRCPRARRYGSARRSGPGGRISP